MKNVLTQYPALRASIYGVVAGTLTIAAIFGIVTQEQLDAVLVNTGLGLGAVGSLLAILNLNGKEDPNQVATEAATSPTPPAIDLDFLTGQVAERLGLPAGTLKKVRADAAIAYDNFGTAAERARADIEARFGHRAD